jgi:signal transduction histidine kinase
MLAHELRNPLAPIRNGLQIMKLAPDRRDLVDQARAMMERQMEQLVRIVDDLLDVSRITRGALTLRPTTVDLAAVVDAAIETSRPLIDANGHRLHVERPDPPVSLVADHARLAQVFSNLLNNAAKFTPPGGDISVRIGRDGDTATVLVQDSGRGIPHDMLAQIFELFTQVDTSISKDHGGLGIGLTVAQRLVHLHGGVIEARSGGPGHGSAFVVRLPLPPDAGR